MELPVKLPHQASTIAYLLFSLLVRLEKRDDKVKALSKKFLELLPVWGFEDLTTLQADYAIRIANYEGELEYEEIHKLFFSL